MITPQFAIKQGDRLPLLNATLVDSDGAAVNLTGASVRFLMRNEAGTVVVNQAATVVSAASGTVRYSWGATDTATAGVYNAEFEVTVDSLKRTFPTQGYLRVTVWDDVG